MDDIDYIKIASDITNQLISICKKNKTNNKSIIELYNELLKEEYKPYRSDILVYIPEQLSIKGYEIVTSNPLSLKKY